MASVRKKDQLLRRLQAVRKLKCNKICADCPARGPQYVCTDFATFICQGCAGVHRDFSHTTKSVMFASFSEEEINKLEETRANDANNNIYLAKYRGAPPLPSPDDPVALKKWIQMKYANKMWFDKRGRKAASKRKKKKKHRGRRRSLSRSSESSSGSSRSRSRSSSASSRESYKKKKKKKRREKEKRKKRREKDRGRDRRRSDSDSSRSRSSSSDRGRTPPSSGKSSRRHKMVTPPSSRGSRATPKRQPDKVAVESPPAQEVAKSNQPPQDDLLQIFPSSPVTAQAPAAAGDDWATFGNDDAGWGNEGAQSTGTTTTASTANDDSWANFDSPVVQTEKPVLDPIFGPGPTESAPTQPQGTGGGWNTLRQTVKTVGGFGGWGAPTPQQPPQQHAGGWQEPPQVFAQPAPGFSRQPSAGQYPPQQQQPTGGYPQQQQPTGSYPQQQQPGSYPPQQQQQPHVNGHVPMSPKAAPKEKKPEDPFASLLDGDLDLSGPDQAPVMGVEAPIKQPGNPFGGGSVTPPQSSGNPFDSNGAGAGGNPFGDAQPAQNYGLPQHPQHPQQGHPPQGYRQPSYNGYAQQPPPGQYPQGAYGQPRQPQQYYHGGPAAAQYPPQNAPPQGYYQHQQHPHGRPGPPATGHYPQGGQGYNPYAAQQAQASTYAVTQQMAAMQGPSSGRGGSSGNPFA